MSAVLCLHGVSWLLTEPREGQPLDDTSTFSDIGASDTKPFDSTDYECAGSQSENKKAVQVQTSFFTICVSGIENK